MENEGAPRANAETEEVQERGDGSRSTNPIIVDDDDAEDKTHAEIIDLTKEEEPNPSTVVRTNDLPPVRKGYVRIRML